MDTRRFPRDSGSARFPLGSHAGDAVAEGLASPSSKSGWKHALSTFGSGLVIGLLLAIVLGVILESQPARELGDAPPVAVSTPRSKPNGNGDLPPVYYYVLGSDAEASALAQAANENSSVAALSYFVVVGDDEAGDEAEALLGEATRELMQAGVPVYVIDLR